MLLSKGDMCPSLTRNDLAQGRSSERNTKESGWDPDKGYEPKDVSLLFLAQRVKQARGSGCRVGFSPFLSFSSFGLAGVVSSAASRFPLPTREVVG